jgi:hypothetical protein
MAPVIARSGTAGRAKPAAPRAAQGAGAVRAPGAADRKARAASALQAPTPQAATLSQRLVDCLGAPLTRGSPVWTSQALLLMRALQQRLLEKGIQMESERRAAVLRALAIVERQVQLRLRLEQHRGADAASAQDSADRDDRAAQDGTLPADHVQR